MAEAAKPRRIIDISNPGETAPNTSSRPILVSHKPSVQDSMVGASAKKIDNQPGESVPVTRVAIQAETPQPPPPESPSNENTALEQTPESEQVTSQPDVKQLVHDKTYFMPVSQPPRRHGIPWFFILLVIMFVLAAGYFVLAA